MGLIDFVEQKFGIKLMKNNCLNSRLLPRLPNILALTSYFTRKKAVLVRQFKREWTNWTSQIFVPVSFHHLISPRFLWFILQVQGYRHGEYPGRPCFIVPNHQTKLDPFVVLSCLDKKTLKGTFSYAKKDHVKKQAASVGARRTNVIVMDLSKDLKESIHKMAEVVKLGKKILFFRKVPEPGRAIWAISKKPTPSSAPSSTFRSYRLPSQVPTRPVVRKEKNKIRFEKSLLNFCRL